MTNCSKLDCGCFQKIPAMDLPADWKLLCKRVLYCALFCIRLIVLAWISGLVLGKSGSADDCFFKEVGPLSPRCHADVKSTSLSAFWFRCTDTVSAVPLQCAFHDVLILSMRSGIDLSHSSCPKKLLLAVKTTAASTARKSERKALVATSESGSGSGSRSASDPQAFARNKPTHFGPPPPHGNFQPPVPPMHYMPGGPVHPFSAQPLAIPNAQYQFHFGAAPNAWPPGRPLAFAPGFDGTFPPRPGVPLFSPPPAFVPPFPLSGGRNTSDLTGQKRKRIDGHSKPESSNECDKPEKTKSNVDASHRSPHPSTAPAKQSKHPKGTLRTTSLPIVIAISFLPFLQGRNQNAMQAPRQNRAHPRPDQALNGSHGNGITRYKCLLAWFAK